MKEFSLLLMILMLVVALCACGEEEKKEVKENSEILASEEETKMPTEQEEGEEEPKVPASSADLAKLEITFNGQSFKIGEKMDDVKPKLGDELRPAQTYTPCGGSDDEQVTDYYYDGLVISATHDGFIYRVVVSGTDYPESSAKIAGIGLKATPDEIKASFEGTPTTDSEYVINYSFDDYVLSFGFDFDGDGLVNYISMDDMSYGML